MEERAAILLFYPGRHTRLISILVTISICFRFITAFKNNFSVNYYKVLKNFHTKWQLHIYGPNVTHLLFPTLIPRGSQYNIFFSSCCNKDSSIIFTTGYLPDINPP
jgi:hypothetical protein